MTKDKFHCTTIQVQIISKGSEAYEPETLGHLHLDHVDGDVAMKWEVLSKMEITPQAAAQALQESESDPELFDLDAQGNPLS